MEPRTIRKAKQLYEEMLDLYERGECRLSDLERAKRRLSELYLAEQSARTYGGELADWTPEAVTA